jgi:SAM-dependent methyltransferase
MTAAQDVNTEAVERRRVRQAYARRGDAAQYQAVPNAHIFHVQERERRVVHVLRTNGMLPLAGKRILEVGCGTGGWLRDFVRWGADPERLHGVDVRPNALEEARRRCPSAVTLVHADAMRLPFADASFDIVVQSTVMSSVLDVEIRRLVAREMRRVVRSSGLILSYDFCFDNPRNRDVRGVSRREVAALFAGCRVRARRITLAPPLARWLVDRSWLTCEILTRVPWLCTHALAAITILTPAEHRWKPLP